jgi:DNA polymerase III epsilon subunit-like protein
MRIVFIDFEASGVSPYSWPIEIGCAWIADGEARSRASLIRPDPHWPEDAWSPQSAEIHGIPRSALDAAPPAAEVAAAFLPLLRSARLVSDAPEYDQRWLDRLVAVTPESAALRIADFDILAHSSFATRALDWVYESLNRSRAPHRAEADARRLARAWMAGARAAGR